MVEYSIAVCNYNMADTVEQSLRSILDQIDDRFEVVVVDGGSDDGSVGILRSLKSEYGALRVVELEPDPDRHLGADRQRSIEEARGDYVLPQLDADDRYLPVIQDFVSIYRQLEHGFESPTYLSGKGINIGPRELLLEIPYRDLRSGEDRDLWRRLLAEDAFIRLHHKKVREEIGYHPSFTDKVSRDLEVKSCDFQVGIKFWSAIHWAIDHDAHGIVAEPRPGFERLIKIAYDLVTFPIARLRSLNWQTFDTPREFRTKGALEEAIVRNRMTLMEMQDEYGVTIDFSAISPLGQEKFAINRPHSSKTSSREN